VAAFTSLLFSSHHPLFPPFANKDERDPSLSLKLLNGAEWLLIRRTAVNIAHRGPQWD
jgi:hypothetical protein